MARARISFSERESKERIARQDAEGGLNHE
jgi:hypothetical protein